MGWHDALWTWPLLDNLQNTRGLSDHHPMLFSCGFQMLGKSTQWFFDSWMFRVGHFPSNSEWTPLCHSISWRWWNQLHPISRSTANMAILVRWRWRFSCELWQIPRMQPSKEPSTPRTPHDYRCIKCIYHDYRCIYHHRRSICIYSRWKKRVRFDVPWLNQMASAMISLAETPFGVPGSRGPPAGLRLFVGAAQRMREAKRQWPLKGSKAVSQWHDGYRMMVNDDW